MQTYAACFVSADRWSDQILIDLISDAHKDLCEHAKILKGTYILPLAANQAIYTLPDEIWMITRASYLNAPISLISHSWLDEQARKQILADGQRNRYERTYGSSVPIDDFTFTDWEDDTGPDVSALIYDRRKSVLARA